MALAAGVDVMGRLSQIAWGPQMRLLGALGADGASVCKKVRLHDKVRDGNSVVQVSADRVMVEAVDGSRQPASLQVNMQITGADATDKHLLVWNSRLAEVRPAACTPPPPLDLRTPWRGQPESVPPFSAT